MTVFIGIKYIIKLNNTRRKSKDDQFRGGRFYLEGDKTAKREK